jgi:transposase
MSTVKRNWSLYNRIHTAEVGELLDYLGKIGGSMRQNYGRGRPPFYGGDMIKVCLLKVYFKVSYRQLTGLVEFIKERIRLRKVPHFNTVRKYMLDPHFADFVIMHIEYNAGLVRDFERFFAVDSTGFGTSAKIGWVDMRYKKPVGRKDYSKLHAIVGYSTGVVASVKVTHGTASDSRQFPELFAGAIKRRFRVDEISGDKAYLSSRSVRIVTDHGAVPYFHPKDNTTLDASEDSPWNQMLQSYATNPEQWLKHYHKRSNIESVFSKIKRKLGGNLRSRHPQARTTELLLKILLHNDTIVHTKKEEYLT